MTLQEKFTQLMTSVHESGRLKDLLKVERERNFNYSDMDIRADEAQEALDHSNLIQASEKKLDEMKAKEDQLHESLISDLDMINAKSVQVSFDLDEYQLSVDRQVISSSNIFGLPITSLNITKV